MIAMLAALGPIIALVGPLIKYGISWLLNLGKVSDDQKKYLEDAFTNYQKQRNDSIARTKEMERRLPKEQEKMDDIVSGKKPWPWERKDDGNS